MKEKKPTKAQQAKEFTALMKSVLRELRLIPNLCDWKIYIHVTLKEFRFKYIGKTKKQAKKELAVIKHWFKESPAVPEGCKAVQIFDNSCS